jgi:hypothetical protein
MLYSLDPIRAWSRLAATMPVFTSTLVSESTRVSQLFTMNVSKKRNGRERGGHTLDEVDGVLPSPPFQDVAVGGLGDPASASHRRVDPQCR